jgi:hypothetical protein
MNGSCSGESLGRVSRKVENFMTNLCILRSSRQVG